MSPAEINSDGVDGLHPVNCNIPISRKTIPKTSFLYSMLNHTSELKYQLSILIAFNGITESITYRTHIFSTEQEQANNPCRNRSICKIKYRRKEDKFVSAYKRKPCRPCCMNNWEVKHVNNLPH